MGELTAPQIQYFNPDNRPGFDPNEDPEVRRRTLEKMRAENRERKKRWRMKNLQRNKDNDLRCRVNKRAVTLYGVEDSEAKSQWIEEEFERRRSRRMIKERIEDEKAGISSNGAARSPYNTARPQPMTSTAMRGGRPSYFMPSPQSGPNSATLQFGHKLPPLLLPPSAQLPDPYDHSRDGLAEARDFWKIVTDMQYMHCSDPARGSCRRWATPTTMYASNPSTRVTAPPSPCQSVDLNDGACEHSHMLPPRNLSSQPTSPHHDPCFRLPALHWQDGKAGCRSKLNDDSIKLPSGMVTPSSITNSPSLPPLSAVVSQCTSSSARSSDPISALSSPRHGLSPLGSPMTATHMGGVQAMIPPPLARSNSDASSSSSSPDVDAVMGLVTLREYTS
ncbi:hypothetical protein H4R34_004133 [Dimargaris verticillata]|uniref:DUF3020 domain-containing protein n=1 Tax=Dimargaris verticillata TaxID=2761393 RepID=A0A9W8E7J3_9FUNG|nr:hypothetical protein H4R34_004133 [Dimargaris verticillata]